MNFQLTIHQRMNSPRKRGLHRRHLFSNKSGKKNCLVRNPNDGRRTPWWGRGENHQLEGTETRKGMDLLGKFLELLKGVWNSCNRFGKWPNRWKLLWGCSGARVGLKILVNEGVSNLGLNLPWDRAQEYNLCIIKTIIIYKFDIILNSQSGKVIF